MDTSCPDDSGVVVGVDVGGSKVALMATDTCTGEDLARDRFPTPADAGPSAAAGEAGNFIMGRRRNLALREDLREGDGNRKGRKEDAKNAKR
jgi:hypothetical protein